MKKALTTYTDLGNFITKLRQNEKFKNSFTKEDTMTA